ncbi:MAG TPA: glucose-6-phosphate dehydrogenase [Dehalococcoidia bacterium]|nr:glucose-6-phosphate dehydrogenase [Dehalococcoidia bacterium]
MPDSLIVLGASGDMARRLLFPAVYQLDRAGKLDSLRIVGYALEDWDTDRFRAEVKRGVTELAGLDLDGAVWQRFSDRLTYLTGDLKDEGLAQLAQHVDGNVAFYLALPPGMFAAAATALAHAGFNETSKGWRRLVIEKPFGVDVDSAAELNKELHQSWDEDQIFRIDHYLGKETVQNILVFRMANRVMDPMLNATQVEYVQLTASETLGLEGRYRYYDGIGAMRDMLQSHLLQLMTLTTMEPMTTWDSEILHDHKVEVLRSIRPFTPETVRTCAVRGQYTSGTIGGQPVPGYLEEQGIPPSSTTETFAALKLYIDNWRWQGVPFYVRSGKRMATDLTEVAITFREPPTSVFVDGESVVRERNSLVFQLKPSEAITLSVLAREPGLELKSHGLKLYADYAPSQSESSSYEQLLLDVIEGDRTSFLRFDGVEWAWRVLQPVIDAWSHGKPETYVAGSKGPEGQDRLMNPGQSWRPLSINSEKP